VSNWADRRRYQNALQRLGVDVGPEGQSFVPATQITYVLTDMLNMRPLITRIYGHADIPGTLAVFNGLIFKASSERGLFVDQLEIIGIADTPKLYCGLTPPIVGLSQVTAVQASISDGNISVLLNTPAGLALADGAEVNYSTATALQSAAIREGSIVLASERPFLSDGLQRRFYVPPGNLFYAFCDTPSVGQSLNFDVSLGLG
jgi:hypothetical protein